MPENTDQIIAVVGLVIVILALVFVFARNIIAQARKNARVRAMRREYLRKAAVKKVHNDSMWNMLEKQ